MQVGRYVRQLLTSPSIREVLGSRKLGLPIGPSVPFVALVVGGVAGGLVDPLAFAAAAGGLAGYSLSGSP